MDMAPLTNPSYIGKSPRATLTLKYLIALNDDAARHMAETVPMSHLPNTPIECIAKSVETFVLMYQAMDGKLNAFDYTNTIREFTLYNVVYDNTGKIQYIRPVDF